MSRLMCWAWRTAVVLSALALATAGYLALVPNPVGPPADESLTLSQTDFEFDALAPGEHEFAVAISNPSRVPKRIIGLAEG